MNGHIRKRGKNSWSIVLDLGRDANGKRRQKWHAVHGTKKDAQRECARLVNSMATGAYVEPSKATLGSYLDHWLEAYARPNVAPKTFERYAEIVRLHLKPELGHHLLAKLQPLHIQAAHSKALESGHKTRKGGALSARTVLHHHRVLREALQQAVKWQLLVRNPADSVQPPKPQSREMQVLDETAAASLLEAAKGTTLHLPIVLAVGAGLRRGEALAVRWADMDLAAGVLSVQQSLEQTKAGLAFKAPKTAKGRRLVTLPGFALEVLKRHRVEQAKAKLRLGPAYEDRDLVCARPDGKPLDPRSVSHQFGEFLKQLALPKVRLHDLRHSHATHLLRQGTHPKIVSERLGHSSISITLDTYSHVLPNMQDEAAKRLDAAIRKAGKKGK